MMRRDEPDAGSKHDDRTPGSWTARITVAGALLAVIGYLVSAFGEGQREAEQTFSEILGQAPPGPTAAEIIGQGMVWIGGALVLAGLVMWATKKITG